MHWPLAVCVMVSGVYAPLTVCQGSGQPTRCRCAANSCLAGTLKPIFTSAVVNSVNSSVRPHVYTEPMNQCDWSVCVFMCLSNGVWYRFVQAVCAAAAGLSSDISCWWISLSLKGLFAQTTPTEVSSQADCFSFMCKTFEIFVSRIYVSTSLKWRSMELNFWFSQH